MKNVLIALLGLNLIGANHIYGQFASSVCLLPKEVSTAFSSVLPLIVVNTDGKDIPFDEKVTVHLGVIYKGQGIMNSPGDERNVYDGPAGIEIRGSSSSLHPKKGYALELRNWQGSDSAIALLGMPEESDWVLHGPYADKSLMRNYLAYTLAGRMGHYAPRTRFCELLINDQYQGVYVLTEKIKRDSERVNIAKLKLTDTLGYDLTGGYIIKIDRTDFGYLDGWFSNYNGTGMDGTPPFFTFHDPDYRQIVDVQKKYIANRINEFEKALDGSNFRHPYSGYRKYIDVPSFIDYFIMVELSKNVDGYRLSTFLHKDRDDHDPLIHMGPVWDYDVAFGNAYYYEASNTSGWSYQPVADGWGTPFWWARFMQDPYFVNMLHCRWEELRDGVLSDVSLKGLVDSSMSEIGEAINRNFIQWPILGTFIWPNAFVGNTYNEDVNFMKSWILERCRWMDDHMPGTDCAMVIPGDADETSIRVFIKPNPSDCAIHIEIHNPMREPLILRIFDSCGKPLYTSKIKAVPLYCESIPQASGVYMVQVLSVTGAQTLKAMVR